jgi:hypothetical protein
MNHRSGSNDAVVLAAVKDKACGWRGCAIL